MPYLVKKYFVMMGLCKGFSITFMALVFSVGLNITNAQSQERPNFIIILVDDMGYSDLGCMGSEIKTPSLDSLANNGVLFTNFYNTARCCPSRASLLTGLYQHQAGVGDMDWAQKNYPSYQGHLSDNAVTMAEVLGDNGYSTFICGKWHLGSQSEHWPLKRGFQKEYSSPKGGGFYFYPPVSYDRPVYYNGVEQQINDPDWYSTDAFTDYSVRFIKEAVDEDKPFFLYLPYIAPHYPIQAFEEDIDKYDGVYAEGYEKIRNARFEKQKKLGIVDESVTISPPDYADWTSFSADKKADRERRMQVYAAMIDRLDMNIGRLKDSLKKWDIDSNTVVMFLSDNGGASTWKDKQGGGIGTPTSDCSYGAEWANVSNTPYRKYKKQTHEGGIITPLITYWPQGLKNKGMVSHEPAHITDIMATCLDIANVEYPATFNGNDIIPLAGETFLPLLNGEKASDKRVMFWEHEGNRAARIGDWKLVQTYNSEWELYNLKEDPTELNDLKKTYPDTLDTLYSKYIDWTLTAGVLDWKVKNPVVTGFSELERLNENVTGGVSSQGDIVTAEAKAIGEYIEFLVPVYVKGYYTITLDFVKNNNHGKCKVIINNTSEIVNELDFYNPSQASGVLTLRNIFLNNGKAKFRFEVTGKNTASSDYIIEMEKISLEYKGTESTGALKFPYPSFNGFVVENLAGNTYSAPDYPEKMLKVKGYEGKNRHAFLIFDVTSVSDKVNSANLHLYFSGTHNSSQLGSDTTFILYYSEFDVEVKGEPTWNSLQQSGDYVPIDTFYVTDADENAYVEVNSEALALKMKELKGKGINYACFIIGRDENVSSSVNVYFHNTSNTNKPYMTLKDGQTNVIHNIRKSGPEFVVMPNPTEGLFTINHLEEGKNYKCSLINTNGKVVYETQINTAEQVDVTHLSNGIYIVRVQEGSLSSYQYLIIRK